MKGRNSKLKRKIHESFKRKLKESFRNDFFDWYDMLSPEKQAEVDAFAEDEGYPEFLSDCSDSDLELIMDHFNPEFFDDYYESKEVNEASSMKSHELENLYQNYGRNVQWDDEDVQVGGKKYTLSRVSAEFIFDAQGNLMNPEVLGESKESKKNKKSCEECDKTIKEGKLHPFTQQDWYAWAGAEDFEDSPPYIYEDPETGNTIIVSGNSGNSEAIVEVDIWKDDDQSISFYREDYNSKEEALADAEDIIATGGLSGDLAYFDSRTGWVKNELGI